MLTIETSLFAGTLEGKGQKKNNKPKDVRTRPSRQEMKTKYAKASTTRDPPLRREEEKSEDEEEEDVATHQGGEPLTGHFTMANPSWTINKSK